jgi:hypothetical protein
MSNTFLSKVLQDSDIFVRPISTEIVSSDHKQDRIDGYLLRDRIRGQRTQDLSPIERKGAPTNLLSISMGHRHLLSPLSVFSNPSPESLPDAPKDPQAVLPRAPLGRTKWPPRLASEQHWAARTSG